MYRKSFLTVNIQVTRFEDPMFDLEASFAAHKTNCRRSGCASPPECCHKIEEREYSLSFVLGESPTRPEIVVKSRFMIHSSHTSPSHSFLYSLTQDRSETPRGCPQLAVCPPGVGVIPLRVVILPCGLRLATRRALPVMETTVARMGALQLRGVLPRDRGDEAEV